MKFSRLFLGVFLILLCSPLEIGAETNATTATTERYNAATDDENRSVALSEDELLLEKWRKTERILKTFSADAVKAILPSILHVSEKINISSRCSNSLMKVIYGFKGMKLWAYKMIDSSGKIPNGVISGSLNSLGDFDGCLSVEVPGSNPFRGQYCSIFMSPPLPKRIPFHHANEFLPIFINFTKKGTIMEDLVRKAQHFSIMQLRTSVCMPSTCSQEEVQTIIETMAASAGLPWDVSVPTCDVTEPLALSRNDVIIICFLGVIGLLAFIATATDVVLTVISKEKRCKVEDSITAVKCLMCFSTYTNTLRLLKKDTSPDSIKIFHGLKVITFLWVMMNHAYYYTNFNLLNGALRAQDFGKQVAFQVIANGFLNVETFFFISAVLVVYGRMKFTGKHISVPLYLFRRVWRLTPPMMLIILTSMLVPHMGSGPGWVETVGKLIDNCRSNWWTNLLFINNFLKSEDMCFQWLWYIPVDTHLYILALFVIVPLKSRPRLAFGINGALFIGATVATAAAHVYYGHYPTGIFVFPHPEDRDYFADLSYFRSYTHITTCCIGMCVGYILATKPKLKIPTVLNVFGWLCSLTLGLLVVYGVYDWNQGNVPGMAISTIYMCTSKVVWALALSYVTIACFTGNGGVITSVLSWSAFVPFSRLTYVTYIIHPIILLMFVGSTRISLHVDHKTIVYRFLANTVLSYIIAYVIRLLFESPFMCLEKVMLSRKRNSTASQKSKSEENGKVENHSTCIETGISTINIKKTENLEL